MVPRYVINFDEFINAFGKDIAKLIARALRNKYPQISTNNLEALLEDIEDLLPDEKYKKVKGTMDLLISMNKLDGDQKIEGRLLDVPPLIQTITETFKFEKDVYLTGLHFNQIGWKKNDVYSLEVEKRKIINDSSIKEVGEHKCFNTYFLVNANTPINFTLSNNSGNSRQTMIDLEYIEKRDPPPPPPDPPGTIGLDDIKNEWDVAVLMNWEVNSPADIDLHGIIDDNTKNEKHVSYSNKDEKDFHLNFDFRSHLSNTNPEIISIKGYKNKKLNIYIHNYSSTKLKEPVNVKVYGKDPVGIKLLKEYNVNLAANDTYLIGVCTIDLNTQVVTDLKNNRSFIK